jgi:hypothetical protein
MPTDSNKGWCPRCRAEIEIPDGYPAHVTCPNCDAEVAPGAAVNFRQESRMRRRRVWSIVAGLALLTLVFFSYWYRSYLFSGFGLVVEATGGRTLAVLSLALALFVLVCFFFWMIFPMLVYFGLRDIRRRTAKLDQTTRLCLRHIAQIPPQQEVPTSEPEPKARCAAPPSTVPPP